MPIKFANIGPKVPFRYNSIDGEITVTQGAIYIETYEVHAIKDLCAVLNIPYTQGDIVQRFTGSNALDILGILDIKFKSYNISKFLGPEMPILPCRVFKTRRDAIIPFKTRESDVGFDLTIIDIKKQINNVCILYTTGISVQPPFGYYSEIVPRSSIIKSGYMLANNIGIIDNSYTGELMIALVKVDPEAAPIELPFRGFQLIFKKQEFPEMQVVDVIGDTIRGDGGFGSTN
jgi:deoxyuridine 5'-triphosphate nucleotidohydrolase